MPKLDTLGPEEGRKQLIENLELATDLARQGRAMAVAITVRPSGPEAEDQFVIVADAPPMEEAPSDDPENSSLEARSRLLYLLDVTLEGSSRLMLEHQNRLNRNPFGQAFKDMGYTKYHILTHDEIKKLLIGFLIKFGVEHHRAAGKDETSPNIG